MSLWANISKLFGGSGGGARAGFRTCVVDAERLADSRGGGIGPVERLQSLQRLAQFASREQVRVQAVLCGRPLREVAHGEELNGVRVFYVEQASAIGDQIAKLAGSGMLAIVGDTATEQKMASRGIATLKCTTLRKALSEGGEGGGQEPRGDRHGMRRRGDRPRRDRGNRGDRGDRPDRGGDRERRPDQAPREPAQESATASRPEPGNETTVKNLIDLVE